MADWAGPSGLNTVFGGKATHPQNGLRWQQAMDYCAWREMHLASEAQWEYAATGPTHRKYPWGDGPEPTCANGTAVLDESGARAGCDGDGTMPVGSKPAGASWSGAMDMAGNVLEWVEDCWHVGYQDDGTRPEDGSAWTVACHGADMSIRGGCYTNAPEALRVAGRAAGPPDNRHAALGARCVRELP